MSINRCMDKDDVVHIHSGILVISEIPFAATWICRLAYSEIREKYGITYM